MNNHLPTDYQAFIHKSRYARYFDGKGRESFDETVERYMENLVFLWQGRIATLKILRMPFLV